MPSLDFAANLIDGYFGTVKAKQDKAQQNALDAAKFLVSTGRVRDYNDLNPLLGVAFGSDQKGQKGKGGKGDPHQILQQFLNPALAMAHQNGGQTAGGQARPSFATPAKPPLLSEDEMQQRETEALRQKGQVQAETAVTEERGTYNEKIRQAADLRKTNPSLSVRDSLQAVGFKFPASAPKYVPGSVSGAQLPQDGADIYGQPLDPKKFYRQGTDASGQITFAPTEAPASAQPSKIGTFQRMAQDAVEQLGSSATYAQKKKVIEQAHTDFARSGQSMTMAEKLELAKQRATMLQAIGAPPPSEAADLAHPFTYSDGREQPFLDMSEFKGVKETNAARLAAVKAGIVPVTPQQATQLSSIEAAKGNLKAMFDSIASKLPKDPQGRPIGGTKNKLSQYFQTDSDLAAAVGWDVTVLPMLRAMNVSNRITNLEFQKAMDARPTITDTLDTAQKKMDLLTTTMERGAHAILDRGMNKDKRAGAPGGDTDLTAKAKRVLKENGKDSSDDAVKAFLARPGNKALLETMK